MYYDPNMEPFDHAQITRAFARFADGDEDGYLILRTEFSAWFATLPADKAVLSLLPLDKGWSIDCEYVTIYPDGKPEMELVLNEDGMACKRPLVRRTVLAVDPPMPQVMVEALS